MMKRNFLWICMCALLLCGTTRMQAQVWGGQLIVRGGFSTNNFKGDRSPQMGRLPGYNFSLDFNKAFRKGRGAYWNTGVMFGTRGYDIDYRRSHTKFRAHNFGIPFTLGYLYKVTGNLAVDGRFGTFFSVDMAGKMSGRDIHDLKIGDIEDYHRCDGGILLGMGVWYKRINVEYTFRRGFGALVDNGTSGSANHMIRLGYAF